MQNRDMFHIIYQENLEDKFWIYRLNQNNFPRNPQIEYSTEKILQFLKDHGLRPATKEELRGFGRVAACCRFRGIRTLTQKGGSPLDKRQEVKMETMFNNLDIIIACSTSLLDEADSREMFWKLVEPVIKRKAVALIDDYQPSLNDYDGLIDTRVLIKVKEMAIDEHDRRICNMCGSYIKLPHRCERCGNGQIFTVSVKLAVQYVAAQKTKTVAMKIAFDDGRARRTCIEESL